MSWLTLLVPKTVVTELKRIADSLERAYPIPTASPAADEDISYIEDDVMAKAQIRADLVKMGVVPPVDPLDEEMAEESEAGH